MDGAVQVKSEPQDDGPQVIAQARLRSARNVASEMRRDFSGGLSTGMCVDFAGSPAGSQDDVYATAVAWSPHNVMSVMTRHKVFFSLSSPTSTLATWGFDRNEATYGVQSLKWAPALLPSVHYPPACWVALVVEGKVFVRLVRRVGIREVALDAETFKIVIPRREMFEEDSSDDEDTPISARTPQRLPSYSWWVCGVEWQSAEVLVISASDSMFVVDLRQAESIAADQRRAAQNTAEAHNDAKAKGGDKKKRGRVQRNQVDDENNAEFEVLVTTNVSVVVHPSVDLKELRVFSRFVKARSATLATSKYKMYCALSMQQLNFFLGDSTAVAVQYIGSLELPERFHDRCATSMAMVEHGGTALATAMERVAVDSCVCFTLFLTYPLSGLVRFDVRLFPHSSSVAEGLRFDGWGEVPLAESDEAEVAWFDIQPLFYYHSATEQKDSMTAVRSFRPVNIPCLLIGRKTILGVYHTDTQESAGEEDQRQQPLVIWKCPAPRENKFPWKSAAYSVLGVCIHSSLHVASFAFVNCHSTLPTTSVRLEAVRDWENSVMYQFFQSLDVWKHYSRAFTEYPKSSFVSRERIASAYRNPTLSYYHRRCEAIVGLGKRVIDTDFNLSADDVSTFSEKYRIDSKSIEEATHYLVNTLKKYLVNRDKAGAELFCRQGRVESSNTWHWRSTLVLVLRIFHAQCVKTELVLGSAICGLHEWISSVKSKVTGGTNRVKSPPNTFCPIGALGFIAAFLLEARSTSSQRSSDHWERVLLSHSSDWTHPADVAFLATLEAFITSLKDDVRILAPRNHMCSLLHEAMHLPLEQIAKCRQFSCSVCDTAKKASIALSLLFNCKDCDSKGEVHTTIFDCVSFEALNLYDEEKLIGKCISCGFYSAVSGALCELCDGIFS